MSRRRRRNVVREAAPSAAASPIPRRAAPPADSPPVARRDAGGARRRWAVWAAAGALVAGGALYLGVSQVRQAAYAGRLPPLPDLSAATAAMREHLEAADATARDRPTSADAAGALGLAYHADMFYDRADRAYALAEELGGDWRWIYYRALASGMRGDTAGLIGGLQQVADADPGFGPAWWRLGEAEFKARRYGRATEAWRRALPLPEPPNRTDAVESPASVAGGPISAYAALGLARLAMVQGDADGARAMLEEVTAAEPAFGPAHRLLGDAYAALDRAEDSVRAARVAERLPKYEPYPDRLYQALVRESRSATFLLQQAATADLTTNSAWREYLLRRALEFEPDHLDALSELATMFRLLRRYDEALEVLARLQRLRPGDARVLADVGRCLSGLRRHAEAETVLREALNGLDNANTRYELGLVLDRLGRLSEAIAEYREAIDRNPNHLQALTNLGVALASQGRLGEATRHFEQVVAVDPDDADARANLAFALAAAGERERAALAFREALRIQGDHEGARAGLQDLELR